MKQLACVLAALCMLLLAGCGGEPEIEMIWELEAQDVLTLSNGESVGRWRSHTAGSDSTPADYVDYRLADGTVLLREFDPQGPAIPEGTLDEAVQKTIEIWHQEQGLRYDRDALLRETGRLSQEQGNHFSAWTVQQTVQLTALSERTVWGETEVQQQDEWFCYSAVFDRATGEPLSLWKLFSVSEDRAKNALLSTVSDEDPRKTAMREALTPERVTFCPDHASVYYPVGSLPGEEMPVRVDVPMNELAAVLRNWAVPQETGA